MNKLNQVWEKLKCSAQTERVIIEVHKGKLAALEEQLSYVGELLDSEEELEGGNHEQ